MISNLSFAVKRPFIERMGMRLGILDPDSGSINFIEIFMGLLFVALIHESINGLSWHLVALFALGFGAYSLKQYYRFRHARLSTGNIRRFADLRMEMLNEVSSISDRSREAVMEASAVIGKANEATAKEVEVLKIAVKELNNMIAVGQLGGRQVF